MGLRSPADYVESLRNGRVTFWDGERIDDITNHPRFATPIANTARDFACDDPGRGGILGHVNDVLRRYTGMPRTYGVTLTYRFE
jgi:hypothetical protein